MEIDEPALPILIGVKSENEIIKLRIDSIGLGSFDLQEKPVQELILFGCRLNTNLIDELKECIMEAFEYEVFEQESKTIFQFWGDYGRIENEFECERFSENFSEYTKADLARKGAVLYDLYVDLHKKFSANSTRNTQLRNKLEFEIVNEIERSQRKKAFFEEKNKGKSEGFQSEIKFLQKIQKLLSEIQDY